MMKYGSKGAWQCSYPLQHSLMLHFWVMKRLFTGFVLLFSLPCSGQADLAQEWGKIKAQHDAGLVHDTVYLLRAQALAEKWFKDPELKEKLYTYRKIAWSDAAYLPFRVKYFAFLANHSSLVYQEGFSIYYLQKMEEELKQIRPYANSLNQPRLLLSIYGGSDLANQGKRMAIIDSVMPFLKSLPGKLSKQSISINTFVNAFTILKHSSQLYLVRKDTVRVFETLNLAQKIWNELEKKSGLDKGKMEQCRLSLYLIESAAASILSERNKEGEILNRAYQTISSDSTHVSSIFKGPFERTILGRLIDYHISGNHIDSVNYYFSRFKNNQSGGDTKFLLYSGKVHAKNGDYMTAFHDILKAYEINDSIISIKIADIQNNMYAHMVSEQQNAALMTAEEEKRNRNLVIFIIVTVLIISICFFVWKLRASAAKANRKIEELNKVTQIQIAELEANANLVQKKMGMELHDDIAGRLVNICNLIERQTLDEKDPARNSRLALISEMARDAYTNTRLKSHEWYFGGLKEERTAFSQRVLKIVDLALPKEKYEKQIEIDDESLEKISSETRINLLRVIQEAVVNILKHAKADRVELFIYEEDGSVALQIVDNGKGFDVMSQPQGKGFGLESLKARAREMNGVLEISSSAKGTELLLNVPF